MSAFPSPDWSAHDHLFSQWAMCVKVPAVCVTVMLLLAVTQSKRVCDYSVIINTYRALIFVELQNMNLTAPSLDLSKEKDHCPSEKVQRLLRYIYNMTQVFSCMSEGRQELKADGMSAVVRQMQSLISQECIKSQRWARKVSCKTIQKRRGRQERRRLKLMLMIRNCWQRLLSVTSF
ncbi:hypothetical protein DNTS_035151 [Danionella cerebrum]|uniref:Uncharacterized protein n=1 Tax=Danionella cerebrum TaxID=2873325 RepID=A0A553N627_9TELE|nr:hypothetical protein DNTS_035151 [Danionella translucida]